MRNERTIRQGEEIVNKKYGIILDELRSKTNINQPETIDEYKRELNRQRIVANFDVEEWRAGNLEMKGIGVKGRKK